MPRHRVLNFTNIQNTTIAGFLFSVDPVVVTFLLKRDSLWLRSYDRLIGTCYLSEGQDIGAELIKRGLALDGCIFCEGKYRHLEPNGVRRKIKWNHIK